MQKLFAENKLKEREKISCHAGNFHLYGIKIMSRLVARFLFFQSIVSK